MSEFRPPTDEVVASPANIRIERVAPSGKIARKLSVNATDSEDDIVAMREMALRQFIELDRAVRELEV